MVSNREVTWELTQPCQTRPPKLPVMMSHATPTDVPLDLFVIDLIDEDTGLADVEDLQGRTFQLPAAWLPEAADGAAYRVTITETGVTFTPDASGAKLLRERSKQTLLDFHPEPQENE